MSPQAAAQAGDLKSLTAALAAGAAVDAPWGDGNTALHEAALGGSVDCVKLLLAKDANVHARGRNDATPFIFAAGNATPAVLDLLHAAGADVNAVSNAGASALMYAAIKGRPETTSWLLEHGADVTLRTSLKQTALNLVAGGPSEREDKPNAHFYPVVAKLLLDAGAEVDSRDKDGWTPLYAAAASGETEIVKLLIDAGADYMATDYGKGAMALQATPLHQACAGLHASTVEVLVKAGARVNQQDKKRNLPIDALPPVNNLNHAAHQACVYWLAKAPEYDMTPGKGIDEVLKPGPEVDVQKVLAYFDKAKGPDALDVNAPILRANHEPPLSLVAFLGSSGPTWCQLASELISLGADVNQNAAVLIESPLFSAAHNGNVEMVKLLLRAKANPNWTKSEMYSSPGFTPLIECLSNAGGVLAAGQGGGGNYEETALELLANGASTDIILKKSPYEGMMPLHFAIKAGFLRATKAIMERGGTGADVYAKVGFMTALSMAEVSRYRTGDSAIEDYLKSVAPPPPPKLRNEPCCVIS